MWSSGTQLHHSLPGDELVKGYLDACWAESTKRAYASDVRDFLAWGGALPASPECLARYLAQRASRLSPATLARRLVGIGSAHVLAGFRDPTKDPLPGMVLKGIRRTHGVAQRRALPLDPRRLLQAWTTFGSLRNTRDKALVLLGFSTAFRRSELVGLDIDDLCWSERGLTIRLRRSKTDQERASRLVAVPWAGAGSCAALAAKHWIEASEIKHGALFRSINARGTLGERLSAQSVNRIVKTLVSLEGIPGDRISAHSLRAGFVTAAVEAGVDLASIQKQTGHASLDALARYIRGVDPFLQNANAKIRSEHFN